MAYFGPEAMFTIDARRQFEAQQQYEIYHKRELYFRAVQTRKKKRQEKENHRVKQAASIPGNKGTEDVDYLLRYIEGPSGRGGTGKKEKGKNNRSSEVTDIESYVPPVDDGRESEDDALHNDKLDNEMKTYGFGSVVNSNLMVINGNDDDDDDDEMFTVVQNRREKRVQKRLQGLKKQAEDMKILSGNDNTKKFELGMPDRFTVSSSPYDNKTIEQESAFNFPCGIRESGLSSSVGSMSNLSNSDSSYNRSRTSSSAFTSDDMESDDSVTVEDFTVVTSRKQKKQLRKMAILDSLKKKYEDMTEAEHLIKALKPANGQLSQKPEYMHLFLLESGPNDKDAAVGTSNETVTANVSAFKHKDQITPEMINVLEDID